MAYICCYKIVKIMNSKKREHFNKSDMLAFAETCMLNLLSKKGKNSGMTEISLRGIKRIKKVLNKFSSDK